MLEPLENLPDGVIGFRAVGTVEPDDYKNLLDPAVDASTDGVRLVYLLGDDFDRYSLGALWQDAKLGGGHSLKTWKRVAVVTNHDWISHSLALFSAMLPGKVQVFPPEELDAAIAWTADRPFATIDEVHPERPDRKPDA